MYPQKLRLGLLLDSFNVPAWVYSVVQRIVNGCSGTLVLLVLNDEKSRTNKTVKGKSIYSLYNRIDEKIFTKAPNPFAAKNIADILPSLSVLKVIPIQDGDNLLLSEADLENIRGHRLDILMSFGFEGLRLETLHAAKYGTWFYYHGDDRIMKGGPPGFWEVVENWSETGTAVLSVGGDAFPDQVLFRSHFITYPLSPARHRSYYFWASTLFLPRQINLLNRLGEERYCQQTKKYNAAPLRTVKKYEAPSNFAAAKAIARIVLRLVKEFFQRIFFIDQWFLLFSLKNEMSDDFSRFNKIVPSKDKFWADPHAAQVNGVYYIFIEEFLRTKNKGHISVIEVDELGRWKPPVTVLEKSYHLSYPFIFKWNDRFYMVPESRENKTIDLYECIDFPHKWVFKKCLMRDVSAVDTTLIYHSNKWWLFTAIAENEAAAPNVELFLFYTDNLLDGEWRAHAQNPIVSDVKRARPAGSLFMEDGKLFRPSQDCSKAYGYGFDLNEVEVLSECEYREKRIISCRPDWDKKILATHTYANFGDLTVIDVFRKTPKIG